MDDAPNTHPQRPCPMCGKPAHAAHRPFCSRRCALLDLGRWLKGDYQVPTAEVPEEVPREEGEE
jgi:uncharacterized protein